MAKILKHSNTRNLSASDLCPPGGGGGSGYYIILDGVILLALNRTEKCRIPCRKFALHNPLSVSELTFHSRI